MTIDVAKRLTLALRGRYERCPARGRYGVYFELTRAAADGVSAYGWYTDATGKPIPGTPLMRLALDSRRTAPDGWRKVER